MPTAASRTATIPTPVRMETETSSERAASWNLARSNEISGKSLGSRFCTMVFSLGGKESGTPSVRRTTFMSGMSSAWAGQ